MKINTTWMQLFIPCSVADLDPGSGAFLTPRSGIPGPKPIFMRACWRQFLDEKYYNFLWIGSNFFLYLFKNKIICHLYGYKKGKTNAVFLLPLLGPGWIKIRIRDKHPGSATLIVYNENTFDVKFMINSLKSKTQFNGVQWQPPLFCTIYNMHGCWRSWLSPVEKAIFPPL